MVTFRRINSIESQKHALKRLQDVQEEIYRQLQLLIPDDFAFHDSLESRVAGSPVLRLEALERHAYTTFLRLTYEFSDGRPFFCAGRTYPFLFRCAPGRGHVL